MKYAPLDNLPSSKAYLHFEATRLDNQTVQVDYELVLPLDEVDCRGTFDHKGSKRPKSHRMIWLDKQNNRRIPLGRTKVGTERSDYPFMREEIDLPFRDGAHQAWDNEKLGGLDVVYSMDGGHWLLLKP